MILGWIFITFMTVAFFVGLYGVSKSIYKKIKGEKNDDN